MPVHRSTVRPPDEDGFAAVLGRALEARGVSLVALQRRLADRGHRVSAGTLSYWRSGQRRPERPASLDAVTEMEELLDLVPGALHSRIGPSRRPGPPLPQVADGGSAPAGVPVRDALRELGLAEAGQQLQDVTLHITLDVDAERQMTRQTVRTMLRATVSGAQRWYHYIFTQAPVPRPLVLDRVVGARVGATVVRSEVGLFASELVLPRPLAVGETAIVETSTRLVDLGEPDTTYSHHIDRRISEVVIWVRFHPAAFPNAACRRCRRWTRRRSRPRCTSAGSTPCISRRGRSARAPSGSRGSGEPRGRSAAVRREVWSADSCRPRRCHALATSPLVVRACSRRPPSSRAHGSRRCCAPRPWAACC